MRAVSVDCYIAPGPLPVHGPKILVSAPEVPLSSEARCPRVVQWHQAPLARWLAGENGLAGPFLVHSMPAPTTLSALNRASVSSSFFLACLSLACRSHPSPSSFYPQLSSLLYSSTHHIPPSSPTTFLSLLDLFHRPRCCSILRVLLPCKPSLPSSALL